MSNEMPMKKQSFLGGAAVLALATAVVKLIGMFFKIPLQMVIHEAGYGYFTTAYDIYSVLLMISPTGRRGRTPPRSRASIRARSPFSWCWA